MTVKQTAGHDQLGDFAPEFARLNDDVLFGEVWSREGQLSLKTRSIVTISALIGKGIADGALRHHLEFARVNGVTRSEMAEILTHIAFYAGWPNAWAAFTLAQEVYDEAGSDESGHGGFFGMGSPNDGFAQYFSGRSWLNPVSGVDAYLSIFNVTFEPRCRNHWHTHRASQGGGQVLICVDGEGWYQEEGKPAQRLHPGSIVEVPANTPHWHGAAADSWFSHLAFEYPGEDTSTEWLGPVDDATYSALEG